MTTRRFASRPGEPGLSRQRERLIGNRTFRRPQTDRRDAELLQTVSAGAIQLLARIAGIREAAGQRHSLARYAADIRIADQRQNRMIKRRGGDFDLPSSREVAINRQHARKRFRLLARNHRLIRPRKIAALADQLDQFLIARQQIFIEPDQKMINLQIAKSCGEKCSLRACIPCNSR